MGSRLRNRRKVFPSASLTVSYQSKKLGMIQPVSPFIFVSEHIPCFITCLASYSVSLKPQVMSTVAICVVCIVGIKGNLGIGVTFLFCIKAFCTFSFIFFTFISLLCIVNLCAHTHMHHDLCGGQRIIQICSLLLPCGSLGSNSVHQAWWKAPFLLSIFAELYFTF